MSRERDTQGPDVPETLEAKQLRLQQEQRCRQIAAGLKEQMPPGTGFILFLCDYGKAGEGSFSYVATVEREDARRMLVEWIVKTGGLQEAVDAHVKEQVENALARRTP